MVNTVFSRVAQFRGDLPNFGGIFASIIIEFDPNCDSIPIFGPCGIMTNLLQNRNKIQPQESFLGMPYKEYKAKMRDERAKETEAKQERKHQLTTSARCKLSMYFMEYFHKMEQIENHNIFVE